MTSYSTFPSFESMLLWKIGKIGVVDCKVFCIFLQDDEVFQILPWSAVWSLDTFDNKYMEVMVVSSGPMPINLPYLLWCLTFYYFSASDQRASWSAVSNIANVSISLDAQCNLEAYYPISLLPTYSIFKERERYSFHLNQFILRLFLIDIAICY